MKKQQPLILVTAVAFLSLLSAGGLVAQNLFTPVEVDMPLSAGGNREIIDTGSDADLLAMAFGNGKYVAVGTGGVILHSDDLRSWSEAESGVEATLQGVAFGHDRFAAVGEDALLLSTDGVLWERHDLGERSGLQAIIFADGRFVALPNDSYSLVSEDGIQWTVTETDLVRNFRHIAYGDGKYIAGGRFSALYASPDGLQWTLLSEVFSDRTSGIAYGAGLWVRAGLNYSIQFSTDGESWSETNVTGAYRPWIAYGNDVFLGVDIWEQRVAVSGNGKHWHGRDHGVGEPQFGGPDRFFSSRGLTFVNGRFAVLATGGRFALYEGDTPSRILSFAQTENRTYALDSLGRILASEEGKFEVLSNSILSAPLRLTVPELDKAVMVGGKGEGMVYENGKLRDLEFDPDLFGYWPGDGPRFLRGVSHDGDGRVVAVGGDRTIFYSDDLVDWTRAELVEWIPGSAEVKSASHSRRVRRSLRDIAYGDGRFVAAGYDGSILYSDDRAIWYVSTKQLGDSLAGVAFGMGRFVVVGKGGVILVSEDGVRWLRHDLDAPHSLTSVSGSAHGFLIGGWEGRVFRSADARQWEEIDLGTTLAVTAVGGTYAGLADGSLWEIGMLPIVPGPTEDGFFSRLAEPGEDLLLDFPEAVSQEAVSYQWYKDGAAIPGETSPSLNLQEITREDAGSYQLGVTSINGTNFSDAIIVALSMDYETWLVERSPFTEAELGDPEITAPLAKPFGDDITNLARYGFSLHSVGDLRGLPRAGIETVDGYGFRERHLTLTFSRPTGTGDIDYQIEASEDLSFWDIVGDWDVISSEVEGETEWVTIRDNAPVTQAPNRFLRTRIFTE